MAQPANSVPLHINTELDLDLGPRFAEVLPRGFGANGIVYSAIDRDCDKKVAVKRIGFADSTSCKYALREIMILRRMQHENIVGTHEILGLNGKSLDCESNLNVSELHSVYIVQDLLDADLYNVIQSGQMKEEHVQFFLYQILRGLKYLHSANVVHRDLKPSNILINCDNLMLKIGDFGLSRVVDPDYDHGGVLTGNMGTTWYRSPEQILHPRDYNIAVDLWSTGCIFAEMLTGRPLCRGVDDLDQLLQILDTVQLQDGDWDEVLTVISNKALQHHPLKITVPLRERLAFFDSKAVDLLEELLIFNPRMRLSAEEALQHPYLKDFSCVIDEPIALSPFHIEYENDNQPANLMQRMILEEIGSQETCGLQMDWSGWEALHAMQTRHETDQLLDEEEDEEMLMDDNGNISPVPRKYEADEEQQSVDSSPAVLVSSLPNGKSNGLTSLSLDNKNAQNQDLVESPTDLEMSNKFFHVGFHESPENDRKHSVTPAFEVNEKYLVEEKDRNKSNTAEETVLCEVSKGEEDRDDISGTASEDQLNEEREALMNMRNNMNKSSACEHSANNIFQVGEVVRDECLEFDKKDLSEIDSIVVEDVLKDADTSIICYDSEEDDARNVIDFNEKNNALNEKRGASNISEENTVEKEHADLDIFCLREKHADYELDEKEVKHDIAQEIAFKEEFNLRQKINSGLQFHGSGENPCAGFDYSWKKTTKCNNQNNQHRNKNRKPVRPLNHEQEIKDILKASAANFAPINRNNHLTNVRLRKNLLSQKLSLHARHDNAPCCEDGFLINRDSTCSNHEPVSPRNGSMDWILFGADSGLHFPPVQVSTSQRIIDESIDNIQSNCGMLSASHDEEFNSRAHPSGAKPKKFSKKTKAL